jgi:arylsulfatase A-like enzyme
LKFVIVVFDGLRPGSVTPGTMPNLNHFQSIGTSLNRHFSVFPSETRVASASLATGSHGAGHGIVGNRFWSNHDSAMIDGSDLQQLKTMGRRHGGSAMTARSLAEVLAKNGHSMMSFGFQSAGSWGISHWGSWQRNELAYWAPNPSRYSDHSDVVRMIESHGCVDHHAPATAAVSTLVDAFLETAQNNTLPAVTLIWIAEPDISQHAFGLNAPETAAMLRHVDAQFARLLDWWESNKSHAVQLLALSDHGHTTIGKKVSVADTLRMGGLHVGSTFDDESDVVLTAQRVAHIWVRRSDLAIARDALAILSEQPWFGGAFSRHEHGDRGVVPGTLSYQCVMADHVRAADLSVLLGESGQKGEQPGGISVYCDGPYPVGVGMHGGLSKPEISALAVLGGAMFGSGMQVSSPTSLVDIAPTIAHGLGIDGWKPAHGRVLHEALAANGDARPEDVCNCDISLSTGHRQFTVHRTGFGGSTYLSGVTMGKHSDSAGAESRHGQ